jgi:hypothetical protein
MNEATKLPLKKAAQVAIVVDADVPSTRRPHVIFAFLIFSLSFGGRQHQLALRRRFTSQ